MTGKSKDIVVEGRSLTFFNQKCREWTHPYPWQGEGDLADSGCGIFSLCHVIEWLTCEKQSPEAWADFSVREGGRGDDGTDRPALLAAMQRTGEAAKHGFRYDGDGLRNDLDALFDAVYRQEAVAFCNLRVGHIVSIVGARIRDGEKQLLIIDSVGESARDTVRDSVREVIPGTEITWPVRNTAGLEVGVTTSYAAFWVSAAQPKDFNLLHRV